MYVNTRRRRSGSWPRGVLVLHLESGPRTVAATFGLALGSGLLGGRLRAT